MKNQILILVILSIFFTNCSRNKEDSPKVTFNDRAYIKIIVENQFDSLIIRTKYSSYFPIQFCIKHQIVVKEKGAYLSSYRITRPDIVEIAIQDTFFVYMIPKDTTVIRIGINTNLKGKSSIYHKIDDPISAFIQNECKNFGSLFFQSPVAEQSFIAKPKSLKEYNEAVIRIDFAQNERLTFLEKNRKDLPEWFINSQKWDYIYIAANLKYNKYFHFRNENLKGEFPPVTVKINNPEAILSTNYYRFINEYFLLTYIDRDNDIQKNLKGPPRMIDLYNKAFKGINLKLKDEILSYFNAYLLASLYTVSDSKKNIDIVDEFSKSHDFGLSDLEKAYVDLERSDINNQIEKLYSLKPGNKAPSFYLKDISGNLHKLSEFQGKIVYLHFWATWCAPCLKDLPYVNQLFYKIENKPILIINICLDDKPEIWKQIIEKEKLQGINLICSGNIGEFLQRSYCFGVIPHYTLLNEKGLIISNFCKRPVDIYDDLMQLIRKD